MKGTSQGAFRCSRGLIIRVNLSALGLHRFITTAAAAAAVAAVNVGVIQRPNVRSAIIKQGLSDLSSLVGLVGCKLIVDCGLVDSRFTRPRMVGSKLVDVGLTGSVRFLDSGLLLIEID